MLQAQSQASQDSIGSNYQRPLLTPRQAAGQLGVTIGCLALWRIKGLHLPFVRIGSRIRYSADDVSRMIEQSRRISTADKGVGASTAGVR